jgi:hypothetical protein
MINTPLHLISPLEQAEADLFQAILEPVFPYPWNPQDPHAETYFAQLEAAFAHEIVVPTQAAFQQILLAPLKTQLADRFSQLPETILAEILDRTTELTGQSLSLADQLVRSVQGLFPHWSVEDLYVLARPYAYAMRSTPPKPVVDRDWQALNELEQVRFGLALAHIVLQELSQRGSVRSN